MRCHTTAGRRVVERKHGIGRATCFKCANLLKVFALKEEGGFAGLIQSRARQYNRAMNVWLNSLVG